MESIRKEVAEGMDGQRRRLCGTADRTAGKTAGRTEPIA